MNTGTKICCAVSLLTLAIGNAMAAGPQTSVTSESQAMSRTVGQNGIDPQALARAQTKLSLAVQLTHHFDASATQEGRTNDLWRSDMIASLMRMNESDFAAVQGSPTLSDAINTAASAASNARAPVGTAAAIGTATQDLTYIPINPCRILDTRSGTGNGFGTGQTRTYSFNSTNVGNGGCSPTVYGSYSGSQLPAAVAGNVTVDETGLTGFAVGSYIAIYPQGGSAGTSFLNFGPGQVVANAGVFSINQSNGMFTVLASAPAQVIIDVYGLFITPLPTQLDCVTTTETVSTLAASQQTFFNAPACPSGYSTVGVRCYTEDSAVESTGSGMNSNNTNGPMFCAWHNYGGTTSGPVAASAQCCRVPGRN